MGTAPLLRIQETEKNQYDVAIVGAGVSGSFLAWSLTRKGLRCLLLEAGSHFTADSYPQNEADANAQLFWSGGAEFNGDASLALLRPKVVGGGSIVNQALVDRFDDVAWEDWRKASRVDFFNAGDMDSWYDLAERQLSIQEIPAWSRNRNAQIFAEGFEKKGHICKSLRRAQSDCQGEKGQREDCIACLWGCKKDSKQSTPVTVLKSALATGRLDLLAGIQVEELAKDTHGGWLLSGRSRGGVRAKWKASRVVLAATGIGNVGVLSRSRLQDKLPHLGHGFYTHPQFMNLGVYKDPVDSHKGPFQAMKSDDPHFRKEGFKLENVFAPPVSLAMLFPGFGVSHLRDMTAIRHMACIEVAVRDTWPGRIVASPSGVKVQKTLNHVDISRRDKGLKAVNQIFESTGAQRIIAGQVGVGLHLMGGCAMGTSPLTSVVNPEFEVWGHKGLHIADSSIFPNAPGINPSLTIMALSLKAAEAIHP